MPQQGEGSDSASTEEEKVDDSSMSTMQEMSEDIYIVEKGDTLAARPVAFLLLLYRWFRRSVGFLARVLPS